MELVDIGANLGHESFDPDRAEVLARARDAGVAQIVVTGASETESAIALGVARTAPGTLFSTAGVHPHHAREWGATSAAALERLAAEPEVVAIGETGSTSTATSRRGPTRNGRSRPISNSRRGWGCRCFSMSATPTSGSWPSFRAGARSFPMPSSTASPATAPRWTPIWISTSTWG